MATLPSLLRRLRKEHGNLTQTQFAGLIGVSVGAVGHWERGARSVDPSNIDAIVTGLKLSPSEEAQLRRVREVTSITLSLKQGLPGDASKALVLVAQMLQDLGNEMAEIRRLLERQLPLEEPEPPPPGRPRRPRGSR